MKRKKVKKETTFGDEVLHGLTDFLESVERGEPITVRTIKLNLEPAQHGPEDVRRARRALGISQAVFAQLLGVSPKTVQSWEQGGQPVPGPARRLLDEFIVNPRYWQNLIGRAVREVPAKA